MKILLVEDEPKLADFLQKGLSSSGHNVEAYHNGSEGLEAAASEEFDLILLDVMLPGQSGLDILKNLRNFKVNTPVIFISALNESEHVIKGLDIGAVDYIRKPFDFDELQARIRTVERKFSTSRETILMVADLKIDLLKREVSRNDQVIELSKREFSMLELLMRNANRVLSKMEITQKIWNIDFDMGSNVIEVHMHQLRKKVDSEFEHKLIQTHVGFGYKLQGELVAK